MTAPREPIIGRIKELEAAGLDEIAFCILNAGAGERIEDSGGRSWLITNIDGKFAEQKI